MCERERRIAELEREVALLKAEIVCLRSLQAASMNGFTQPLVVRAVPMTTQSQPEGNFWNPQLRE
jgi:hypothetical protein